MIVNKSFDGLEYDSRTDEYVYNGDIHSAGGITVELDKDLRVEGTLYGKHFIASNVGLEADLLKSDGNIVCVGGIGARRIEARNIMAELIGVSDSILADGNLKSRSEIISDMDIIANGNVEAKNWICAGKDIKVKGSIITGKEGIEAGFGITAGNIIKTAGRVICGVSIWDNGSKITCKSIKIVAEN